MAPKTKPKAKTKEAEQTNTATKTQAEQAEVKQHWTQEELIQLFQEELGKAIETNFHVIAKQKLPNLFLEFMTNVIQYMVSDVFPKMFEKWSKEIIEVLMQKINEIENCPTVKRELKKIVN